MTKQLAAAAALALVGLSVPANAYPIRTTGRTAASPQLAADILTRIARYSKATGGCSMVFSADMRLVGTAEAPALRSAVLTHRGAHAERWTLNICAARQVFEVAMWPSPRGGSDFAVVPLTGRMSLAAR